MRYRMKIKELIEALSLLDKGPGSTSSVDYELSFYGDIPSKVLGVSISLHFGWEDEKAAKLFVVNRQQQKVSNLKEDIDRLRSKLDDAELKLKELMEGK